MISPPGELAMFLAMGAGPSASCSDRSGRRWPGGSAVAPDADEVQAEVDQVNERVTTEVEDLRARLAEVEERLDFAERLLARGGEPDQISKGA